ncbi:MAG: endonuclease/exonuclease/phosphatase family protein [Marinosulfonomonas sp.]
MLPASADTYRIATLNTGLSRKGPGLLLRDILRGEDAQILMVRDMIAAVRPDILVLTGFDYDYDLQALARFQALLAEAGHGMPHRFAFAPNSGMYTGVDMDGDGRLGTARDAQGFGEFAGQGGMAILSVLPIDAKASRDFSTVLWAELPGASYGDLPVHPAQRLSSVGHWDVPIDLGAGERLHLLAFHATTPAFDGPEDRNGFRNRDEIGFWSTYLDGGLGVKPPDQRFVIVGDANLDPVDGDGQRPAIADLLARPDLQDPRPSSRGGAEASQVQGGVNARQGGDPALDTADWRDVDGPGNLRVDYVLPSRDLTVTDAGVFWPASGQPGFDILAGRDLKRSWHGLVWVDVLWQ